MNIIELKGPEMEPRCRENDHYTNLIIYGWCKCSGKSMPDSYKKQITPTVKAKAL